jgi:hypothetical protein
LQRGKEREFELEKERLRVLGEDQKKLMQMDKDFRGFLSNTSWLPQTINALGSDLIQKYKDAKTLAEKEQVLLNGTSDFAAFNMKAKAVMDNINRSETLISQQYGKGAVYLPNLRNDALQMAFFNKSKDANGNEILVPKKASEIDESVDYMSLLALDPAGQQGTRGKYFSGSKGLDVLETSVNKVKQSADDKDITYDKGGKRVTESFHVKWNNKYQYYDEKTKEIRLRTGADGLIEQSLYEEHIQDTNVYAYLSGKTNEFITAYANMTDEEKDRLAKSVDPNATRLNFDPTNEKIKDKIMRRYMTDAISKVLPQVEKQKNQSVNIRNTYNMPSESDRAASSAIGWFDDARKAAEAGDINTVKDHILNLRGGNNGDIIENVTTSGNTVTVKLKSTSSGSGIGLFGSGGSSSGSISINLSDPSDYRSKLSNLYQQTSGSNRQLTDHVRKLNRATIKNF